MAFEGEVPQELLESYFDIFSNWYKLMNLFNLPSYDTIRDIQRKHPELQPSEPIKKLRKERQERIKKMFETERKRDKLTEWLEEGEQLKHE